jgi:heme/copper-type cytochrome/quinol oxidase subunit 2
MQTFIDFLVNNYLWFLVISLILVFALIGYLVDTNEKKEEKEKIEEMPNIEGKTITDMQAEKTEILDDL